jgi:hypothetical protein
MGGGQIVVSRTVQLWSCDGLSRSCNEVCGKNVMLEGKWILMLQLLTLCSFSQNSIRAVLAVT